MGLSSSQHRAPTVVYEVLRYYRSFLTPRLVKALPFTTNEESEGWGFELPAGCILTFRVRF